MNGWNVSVVRNLNEWFGLVADFSGHYGGRLSRSQTLDGEFTSRTSKSMHLFLVGPRVSLFKTGRFTPFAHGLFGAVHAHTSTEDRLAPFPPFKDSNSEVAFAAAFGVGLDIRLNKVLALRAVQADYVLTKLSAQSSSRDNRDNLRVSTELAFRFGKVR